MYSVIQEIVVYILFLFIVLVIAYSNQTKQAFNIKTTYTNMLVHDEIKAEGIRRSFVDVSFGNTVLSVKVLFPHFVLRVSQFFKNFSC